MSHHTKLERFAEAYRKMALDANYRPAAPSDGMGHVLLTKEQVSDPERLWHEAIKYANQFNAEEDKCRFHIGCSDYRTNRAFVWIIEAARNLASGDGGNATCPQAPADGRG
jgi:hypothetical protein